MFRSLDPRLLLLLALPACVDATDPETPDLEETDDLPRVLARAGIAPFTAQPVLDDPPPPRMEPAPIPPRPTDGDYLLVRGPTGAAWLPYHLDGDDVMIGDDVALGTVDEVFGVAPDSDTPVAMALGESTLLLRWPDGIIYYEIDLDVGIPNAIKIYEAMDAMEAALPVKFVMDADAPARVRFLLWDQPFGAAAGVGRSGSVQDIKLPQTVNVRTVAHEVLHILGRFHEQQRPDRDQYVEYHPECVREGAESNFTELVGELALGPYDMASLLHYRGTSQCAKDENDDCICNTLEYPGTDEAVESPTSNCDQSADPVCFYSDLDIGATWTMYGDFHDDDAEWGDYLGWATAAGDFDGDGLDDIASSAVLAEQWRGEVMTFKGSYGIKDGMWAVTDPGLVPWRVLRPTTLADAAQGDLFGSSLVVADFDDDGFDDLAIGAPGVDGHGAVHVYRGSRVGLVADAVLDPTTDSGNLPFAGADYGTALAAADLDDDGVPELVVGAPGDRPGIGGIACGGVYAYHLDGEAEVLARWNPGGASCIAGTEAGASLAGSTREGDEGDLLVVGAPGADTDRGRVWVVGYANTPTLSVYANLTQATQQVCGVGGVGLDPREAGDRFGAAVAAGTRIWTQHIIAVGSPGENTSTGRVDVFRWSSSCWAREQELTEAPLGVDEAGDQFGAALAIGDLTEDNRGDLLVGAPGEAVGNTTAGWMYTWRGTADAFVPHHGFGQSTGGWTNGNDERFGQSFALAEIDGNVIDLVVGAAGNHVGGASYAGSLFVWQSSGDAVPKKWQALSTNSKSPLAQ
jgi:hypothetical protein